MEYTDYLAHYGILGMRWGIRRFQNRDGSLTAAGRKRAGVGEKTGNARHKPSSAKKLAKQRAAALEKARQAKAAKKEYETNKKEALAKGSAADVLKFKGDLSNKELQDAFNRINLERQLSQIASSEVITAWDKADKIANKIGKLTEYTNKGINAWNAFAKINNSLNEQQMPIIGEKYKTEEDSRISKILKSGSAEEVLKLVQEGKTTKAQREEAINRFNSEDILKKRVDSSESTSKPSEKKTEPTSKTSEKKSESTSKTSEKKSEPTSKTSEKKSEPTSKTSEKKSEPTSKASEKKSDTWTPSYDDISGGSPKKSSKQAQKDAEEYFKTKFRYDQHKSSNIYEADWTDVNQTSAKSAYDTAYDYAKNIALALPSYESDAKKGK